MMINVVASTGGSAQSSPSEGIDTRPRNMFTLQFELDINVEVQKEVESIEQDSSITRHIHILLQKFQ